MKPPEPPRTLDEARDYIARLLGDLEEKDYAFSVEAIGHTWDVYQRRDWQGVPHTIVFRMENKNVIVGVVVPVEISERTVVELLERDVRPNDNDVMVTVGTVPVAAKRRAPN